MFPDYSKKIEIKALTYTAKQNGWIFFSGVQGLPAGDFWIKINGVNIIDILGIAGTYEGTTYTVTLPISKGDNIENPRYVNGKYYFIPSKF